MLQTHVNNDIYNKYCLIHNTDKIVSSVLRQEKVRSSKKRRKMFMGWSDFMHHLRCFCYSHLKVYGNARLYVCDTYFILFMTSAVALLLSHRCEGTG